MKKCKLIAEVANSHCGDFEKLKKIIHEVAKTGCENIKFQLFNADELVTKDHIKYDGYVQKQFTPWHWEYVSYLCKQKKLNIYCDVFDYSSIKMSDILNPAGYKIHSTNLDDDNFITAVCKKTNYVIISTGGCFLKEIKNAVNVANLANKSIEIVLMTGIQNFPTDIHDTNINKIDDLRRHFGDCSNISFGLQDHIDGEDYLSRIIPFVGKTLGYNLIEKHITLNRANKETDYFSSLNPDEFKLLVDNWERFDNIFGNDKISVNKLTDAEIKYRKFSKKSAIAKRNIRKGEVLTSNCISYKRSTELGFGRKEIENFIGKKLKCQVPIEKIFKGEYFEQ